MTDIAQSDAELSVAAAVLIKRALAKDPGRRHSHIHSFKNASIAGEQLGHWRITVQPLETWPEG